ncbi:hypothetical protein ACIGBL_33650 [Streptomyces sp. NPDC085614]|uniref:hypothetical protein n=1 Tax=Streptomyces sp. NPDC085614 TaxID=3365733 RepID=UPI0037D2D882
MSGLSWKGVPVPYIVPWTGEQDITPTVVPRGFGIGFLDDDLNVQYRDTYGALWTQRALGRGRGEPLFQNVHPLRQRRAMLHMLCQVCGQPAEDDNRGTLFLIGARAAAQIERTAHPPLCPPCAQRAVSLCPHLIRNHLALRSRRPTPWGIFGHRYAPGKPFPVSREQPEAMSYNNPDIRWMLAGQIVVELRHCIGVDLAEEFGGAIPA